MGIICKLRGHKWWLNGWRIYVPVPITTSDYYCLRCGVTRDKQ